MGHIIDRMGHLIPWNPGHSMTFPIAVIKHTKQLVRQSNSPPYMRRVIDLNVKCLAFYAETPIQDDSHIWILKIPRKEHKTQIRVSPSLPSPKGMLSHFKGALHIVSFVTLPLDTLLVRVIFGLPCTIVEGRHQLTLVAS